MRERLEKLFPAQVRWLKIFHMDHFLDFNSPVRIMLLLSCIISLTCSISWILDTVQLSCFMPTPWNQEGVGQYTCLYQFVGGILLFVMFCHSATALAYYDEDDEALRMKKERDLHELEQECGDVLQRATGQAKKLCGMMTADLDEKVREHVDHMMMILKKLQGDHRPEAMHIHESLVTQMAHHLHQLRKPALDRFEKLIDLSGRSDFMAETLRRQRKESMVALLTGKKQLDGGRHGIQRTETLASDVGADVEIGGAYSSGPGYFSWSSLGCHVMEDYENVELMRPQQWRSVHQKLSLPTEADLVDELRDLDPDEVRRSPEKLVLRPLRLVLKWFEKTEQKKHTRSQLPPSRSRSARDASKGVADQVDAICTHLKNSSLYRWMILGIFCSLMFALIYAHMLVTVWTLMRNGGCKHFLMPACIGALLRQLIGVCAMLCYAISLGIVMWNIDRLDAVLQVHQEIRELEDFKRQVNQINANDLVDEETSAAMIEAVLEQLFLQRKLIGDFYNRGWGGELALSDYERLDHDLARALVERRVGYTNDPDDLSHSVAQVGISDRANLS
eukprot:TRINITY_DN22556_c0_g1_i1.p1 TRINITY_DN22556_c0_g1~~TRINITY_DN22556_c0_g1_i1.p1  ORF type:complete len:561 (-),score=66.88 TRINITY_DN22556_c0_g1_i1:39-1721(-)